MAINVICPGCHKRFTVSEKFAGKRGPCPKCKGEILIPSAQDEVKIHGGEAFGPKDKTGRATLQPIFRAEPKITLVAAFSIGAAVATVFLIALVLRFSVADKQATSFLMIMSLGAIVIAPPLALGGYAFVRNDELEPYRGQELWVRVGICAAVYAIIWGVIGIIDMYAFQGDGFSLPMVVLFVPLMAVAGAGIAHVSLDLDFFSGIMHYGLYLLVSVLLRLLVGIAAFPMDL